MKRRHIFQMGVLSLFGMGVLLSMVAFDPPGLHRKQELLSLSVILRGADSASWPARQGMEQAAVDLGAELRFWRSTAPTMRANRAACLRVRWKAAPTGSYWCQRIPKHSRAMCGGQRQKPQL